MRNRFAHLFIPCIAALLLALLISMIPFIKAGKASAASFSSGPSITPSSSIVRPGQKISVTGQSFGPNDTVQFDSASGNGDVGDGTLTCDSNGNCSGTISISLVPGPQGQYPLIGVGSPSGLTAQVTVTVVAGFYLAPASGGAGMQTGIHGAAFAANETVKVYWGSISGILEGTATSDASGQESPGMVLNPQVSQAGRKQLVQVSAGGFTSGMNLTVSFEGNTVASGTTDATGAFTATFTVAATTPIGIYDVQVDDSTGKMVADTYYDVIPVLLITPSVGSSGTKITVIGRHFSPSNTVSLMWIDANGPGSESLGNVTTNANGDFQITITAPANLTSGTTYFVQASDQKAGVQVQAAFAAQ